MRFDISTACVRVCYTNSKSAIGGGSALVLQSIDIIVVHVIERRVCILFRRARQEVFLFPIRTKDDLKRQVDGSAVRNVEEVRSRRRHDDRSSKRRV